VEDTRYVPDGPHKFAVADMITGYGVAESVCHYYRLFRKQPPTGKKAIIQGWGNVASAAACYLAVKGVLIVGIIDRDGGIIREEGLGLEEVKELFLRKQGNRLATDRLLSFEETNARIWHLDADVFVPGAASKLVTRAQVDNLLSGGLEVIACGANVPFVDDGVFFGPTAGHADRLTSLIPDFIANCGMARVFAYLMQPHAEMTDQAIFEDVSDVICKALEEVYRHNPSVTGISASALEIALQKLLPTPQP
jgi:glutamate dehydrogenase/leucine dehydrogenase